MKTLLITCTYDHAVDVISALVKQAAPFKVDVIDDGRPDPAKVNTPLKRAPTPASGTLKRGSRRPRTPRTPGEEVASSGGLRAILKAGLAGTTFTAEDVRQSCVSLGLKRSSASPNLTYFKRDGRFVVQNADKSYTLTELGDAEARKLAA